MAEVSFIGLGAMGFALADTAAKSGRDIVVWNRSSDKARALVNGSVTVASTPAEAVSASPIIIVCVNDYPTTEAILGTPESMAALKDRTLVQLSSGSPALARSAYHWAKQVGVSYLDGEILAYVSQVGCDAFPLYLAGDRRAYEAAEAVLKLFTPQTRYLGTDPVKSSALNLALLSGTLGLTVGILNGAALCEAAGIPFEELMKDFPTNAAYDAEALLESFKKLGSGDLESSDAPIEVWSQILNLIIEFQQESGYATDVSDPVRQLFNKAEGLGLGSHDVGSLVRVLGPEKT